MKKCLLLALLLGLALCLFGCEEPDTPPEEYDFTVVFTVGDDVYTQYYNQGDKIKYPKAPRGYVIAGYDVTVKENVTADALYTAILTKEANVPANLLMDAYKQGIIVPRTDGTGKIVHNNPSEYWDAATAMYILALEEYVNPQSGPVRDQLLIHLTQVTSRGSDPRIDCLPLWWTPSLTGAIVLSRLTPTIWDELTEDEQDRLDCLMRAFVYTASFGNADWNDFNTGPGLFGDYRRDWNVNYALSNITPMINAVIYFGQGYNQNGIGAVNTLLKEFDYDTFIAELEGYGFSHVLEAWASDEDRVRALSMNGISCDLLVESSPSGATSGSGAGVRPPKGYTEFTYHGWTLSQVKEIVNYNFLYCFSGGVVTKDGCNGNGYTINAGDDNPMLGKTGMLAELNQGSRSSIGYCLKDFVMFSIELSLLDTLGVWSIKDNSEIMKLAEVGMNDFIYKYKMGYHSWVYYGSRGETVTSDDYESSYAGYYYARALWMYNYDGSMLYLFENESLKRKG